MDDEIVTTSRAEGFGFSIGRGVLVFSGTGNEFVFGVRWTDGFFGVCLGPFMVGYMWRNDGDPQ